MGLEDLLGDGFISTRIKDLLAWGRKNSLWPMPFGTACCAIEMMATLSSRYDMSRFGAEVVRFSPRQSDMLIVGGRVTLKMMPVLQRIWLQMPEPKWSISMGACASCGGVFDTYTMIQGVDQFIPVDVYIPGCPPRPENLIDAVRMIQDKVSGKDIQKMIDERTGSNNLARWEAMEERRALLRQGHLPRPYEAAPGARA
ncbi:MAG: NADH-quinone oxidoreductase subunit B [Planctomycetes bacterium]|nr:NADH-quinone oxidoreductase subunit B [Planctomycetota bacterium]MCW8137847.1 NADH-quinone oxidoreductase subunit B [Planctomycetota bacterium]